MYSRSTPDYTHANTHTRAHGHTHGNSHITSTSGRFALLWLKSETTEEMPKLLLWTILKMVGCLSTYSVHMGTYRVLVSYTSSVRFGLVWFCPIMSACRGIVKCLFLRVFPRSLCTACEMWECLMYLCLCVRVCVCMFTYFIRVYYPARPHYF